MKNEEKANKDRRDPHWYRKKHNGGLNTWELDTGRLTVAEWQTFKAAFIDEVAGEKVKSHTAKTNSELIEYIRSGKLDYGTIHSVDRKTIRTLRDFLKNLDKE